MFGSPPNSQANNTTKEKPDTSTSNNNNDDGFLIDVGNDLNNNIENEQQQGEVKIENAIETESFVEESSAVGGQKKISQEMEMKQDGEDDEEEEWEQAVESKKEIEENDAVPISTTNQEVDITPDSHAEASKNKKPADSEDDSEDFGNFSSDSKSKDLEAPPKLQEQ